MISIWSDRTDGGKMVQKKVRCPACNKQFTEGGLRLHFRQALSGLDPFWNISVPHIKWARNKGLEVTEDGYTFNYEKLNECLDEYLSNY